MATTINVFAAAKKKESPAKKADKKEILIEDEGKLSQLIKTKMDLENLTTLQKSLDYEVKQLGQAAWIKEYQTLKRRPDSFHLKSSKTGDKMLIIVMDKYASIDETRAGEIREQFGEDAVEETTEYSFNTEILKKHQEAIGAAIAAMDIPDEDKANLLVVSQKFSIAKGMIERFAEKGVETAFYNLAPQVQLKNAGGK